ncbi:Receptor tyrosine-protein kinase erbB-3 [Merluccius polli]|uniref:receptor protein-tyrosine kinase n=1 Tax=Merluccius polli TaxID=89951 RepID=A0AA47P3A8_MERPO|nr:Receptor tyrosine-protein kinase erbB-3 [Merluccius polli]
MDKWLTTFLYLTLLSFLQTTSSQTHEVVCSGTQNSLSSTGTQENQYKLFRDRYEGCRVIMGNLEITQMDTNRDFSFLKTIREVTGYVLIAMNLVQDVPLDRLRVIRGNTLYERQFALSVFLNYPKDGSTGLKHLGLTNLTDILAGGVQIINNKYLSYGPWVSWQDIVTDSSAAIVVKENGEKGPCHPSCGDYCWGPRGDQCQILTKTVCALQCNGRCFGTSPRDCCHVECAVGCTGPHDVHCLACRHFNDSGACVPRCPQALIYNKQTFQMENNPNAKYQYGSICVSECPTHFVVDDSSCVSGCPPDKTEPAKAPALSTDRQVDSSNIDSFINCTKIQGSLHFLITGIAGDAFNKIPPLDAKKLEVFRTVREITDILKIESWPEQLNDLSVFSSLTIIQGRSLYKSFSLVVMRIPTLGSLGLRSLREINDGSVYISQNINLCYHHTVNWTRLLHGRNNRPNDIKLNRPLEQCVAEGHVCDPLCSEAGCWGPGPAQCVSCRNYSRAGVCVASCHFYTGEVREMVGSQGDCVVCHPECQPQNGRLSCTGPSGGDEGRPEELHHRESDRGLLDDQDLQDMEDGMATLPLHFSPPRSLSPHSLSRLRMGSHRSCSSPGGPVGYLPMVPKTGEKRRSQRSRLTSASTVSEGLVGQRRDSEEREIAEAIPLTGSLHRPRRVSRKSSAAAAAAAAEPSPRRAPTKDEEDEEEIDRYGYVLPGSSCSGTGPVTRLTHAGGRNSSSPRGPLSPSSANPPDSPQEYEVMNQQADPPATDLAARTPVSAASPAAGAGAAQHSDTPRSSAAEEPRPPDVRAVAAGGGRPDSRTARAAEEPPPGEEARRDAGEYEDMDVSSGSHAEDQDTSVTERRGSQTRRARQTAVETAAAGQAVKEQRQEGECGERLCSNEQARLVEKINGMAAPNAGSAAAAAAAAARTAQEYEEMDGFPTSSSGCDEPEYQNLPGQREGGDQSQNLTGQRAGGAQEMGSGMQCASFDNPDYWHSRLFAKPDAIRT